MVKPAYKPLSHQDNIISIVIIARPVAVHFRLDIFIMTYFYHLLWNHWDIHGNNFPGIFQLCMSTLHNKNKSHFQTLANLKLCMLLLNRLLFLISYCNIFWIFFLIRQNLAVGLSTFKIMSNNPASRPGLILLLQIAIAISSPMAVYTLNY